MMKMIEVNETDRLVDTGIISLILKEHIVRSGNKGERIERRRRMLYRQV